MRIILIWFLEAYVAGFRGIFCILVQGFMIYLIDILLFEVVS